jgi:hypothetical protein
VNKFIKKLLEVIQLRLKLCVKTLTYLLLSLKKREVLICAQRSMIGMGKGRDIEEIKTPSFTE